MATGHTLLIIRSDGGPADRHELDGETLLEARISAAILYAGMAFEDDAPCAYLILGPNGDLVYRFPEG